MGGTTTSLGFVDRNGNIVCDTTLATLAHQPALDLVDRICEAIEIIHKKLPKHTSILGVGLGAPDANYLRGTVENPTNLSWDASTNLVEMFRQRYDVPVAITNDANAAAIGEQLFGGASEMKHFIVITLGTGLGSGVFVNGELLYGADGFAGEIGQVIVNPDGRQCACGRRGCLETYVSATGLCRTVFELLAQRLDPSPLREISFTALTSKLVYEAACIGDPIALAAFDMTAKILGMKLADTVAHFSPEAIFFSGGLAAAGDLLLTPTRHYLEEFLFSPYKGKVILLQSKLYGSSGAVLGAAALAWNEVDLMHNLLQWP